MILSSIDDHISLDQLCINLSLNFKEKQAFSIFKRCASVIHVYVCM